MHHVALDRLGPYDRDLDYQIIESSGFHARQHRHLRPAFDLEGPQRVRLPDHRIGAWILGRNGGEIMRDAFMLFQQIETPLHAGEHAERQTIDLHNFQNVDIVLVPFDDLPILHGGGLDRHQFIQPVACQHKAARMLREMLRRAHQFTRKIDRNCWFFGTSYTARP
jgi:hypothetical protein